jgi:hypothetical protein
MDTRIEAAPMTATAQAVTVVIKVVTKVYYQTIALIDRVVSFSFPSIGGCSLSAVAPDHTNLNGGRALATALVS